MNTSFIGQHLSHSLILLQKTVPVVLRRETEFLLFLEELQKDVSEEVLKVSYLI